MWLFKKGLAERTDGESLEYMDFLTEEEYLDILDELPKKTNT